MRLTPTSYGLVRLDPEPFLDLIRQPVAPLVELRLREIGDRMWNVEERVARLAPALGHGLSGVAERGGDDGDRGHPLLLHQDRVERTARAARPSVADSGHDEIGLRRQGLDPVPVRLGARR